MIVYNCGGATGHGSRVDLRPCQALKEFDDTRDDDIGTIPKRDLVVGQRFAVVYEVNNQGIRDTNPQWEDEVTLFMGNRQTNQGTFTADSVVPKGHCYEGKVEFAVAEEGEYAVSVWVNKDRRAGEGWRERENNHFPHDHKNAFKFTVGPQPGPTAPDGEPDPTRLEKSDSDSS